MVSQTRRPCTEARAPDMTKKKWWYCLVLPVLSSLTAKHRSEMIEWLSMGKSRESRNSPSPSLQILGVSFCLLDLIPPSQLLCSFSSVDSITERVASWSRNFGHHDQVWIRKYEHLTNIQTHIMLKGMACSSGTEWIRVMEKEINIRTKRTK
jgi:hypothetical protein